MIYEDIKAQLGIDFVPNLYKAKAAQPVYLEANWRKVKTEMVESGKPDRLTKARISIKQIKKKRRLTMWRMMQAMCQSNHSADASAMCGQGESPPDILKRRYALGEITREQFEVMKRTLGVADADADSASEHAHHQEKGWENV